MNSSNVTAVFFSGYHPEAAKFVAEARKERNNAFFISGDGVKDPSFIVNAGKNAMEYYVSAPFDLSKVANARSVTEQYEAEFGSDPTIIVFAPTQLCKYLPRRWKNLAHQIHPQ